MDMKELIKNIPMKRWLLASKRLDATAEEIMNDGFLATIVAACEKAGRDTGNFDQYTRFLDMSVSEITEFIEPSAVNDSDANKSDDDSGDGFSD